MRRHLIVLAFFVVSLPAYADDPAIFTGFDYDYLQAELQHAKPADFNGWDGAGSTSLGESSAFIGELARSRDSVQTNSAASIGFLYHWEAGDNTDILASVGYAWEGVVLRAGPSDHGGGWQARIGLRYRFSDAWQGDLDYQHTSIIDSNPDAIITSNLWDGTLRFNMTTSTALYTTWRHTNYTNGYSLGVRFEF